MVLCSMYTTQNEDLIKAKAGNNIENFLSICGYGGVYIDKLTKFNN